LQRVAAAGRLASFRPAHLVGSGSRLRAGRPLSPPPAGSDTSVPPSGVELEMPMVSAGLRWRQWFCRQSRASSGVAWLLA